MKQMILIIILYVCVISSTFSYSIEKIDTDIKYYITQIKEVEEKQRLLNIERRLLKTKYKNIISETRKQIEVNLQQSVNAYNKLGLGSSSAVSSQSKTITDEGNRKIDLLEQELEYNLSIMDKNIAEYGTLSNQYKNRIEDLNILKKKKKIFNDNFDEGSKLYNEKEYKNSIQYYKMACNMGEKYGDLYACYYNLGLSYSAIADYNNAKVSFYKSIDYAYNYERKAKSEDQIEYIKSKKIEIENKTEEDIIKENLEIKAGKIFLKLEKKFSKLDSDKKVMVYKNIIGKFEKFKDRSKNKQLIILVDLLIEKMENSVSENIDLENEIFKIIAD